MVEWKSIKEFDNFEVSNTGIVRNKNTKREKGQSVNERGYKRVTFYKNNKNINKYIHRLVAEAFIPNPENKPTVNHEDGNKNNNCVDNLSWATYSEQMQHALKVGLIKIGEESPCYNKKMSDEVRKKMKISRNKNKSIYNKRINQYDMEGNFIKEWESINDAIRYYNNKAIEFCCVGKRNSASGYKWKFVK